MQIVVEVKDGNKTERHTIDFLPTEEMIKKQAGKVKSWLMEAMPKITTETKESNKP